MKPSPRPSLPSDLARLIAEPLGPRRRVELARLAAERVPPIWYAEAPGDHGPEAMLALAAERLSRWHVTEAIPAAWAAG